MPRARSVLTLPCKIRRVSRREKYDVIVSVETVGSADRAAGPGRVEGRGGGEEGARRGRGGAGGGLGGRGGGGRGRGLASMTSPSIVRHSARDGVGTEVSAPVIASAVHLRYDVIERATFR